jgi:ferredoxin-NADP reductase
VPLLRVEAVTPRSRLVTLDLRNQRFDFRAGHAVLIGQGGERRPYSIASSPERAAETQSLELLIAVEPDGTLGPHLAMTEPGSPVDLEGPMGTFLFPEELPTQRLVFVAGGTGIAPLRAMLDHVLRNEPPYRISLLYSVRNADEFAFREELRAHEASGRLELHCTVTRDNGSSWSGNRGRIGRTHFKTVVHDAANTLCFVCGPKALVNESVSTLAMLGVPSDAIRTEAWVVTRA